MYPKGTHDGRIAAIATNHSGGMTTVTIHGLHFEPVLDRDEEVYEFHHFHHVASRSLIIRGEFVTKRCFITYTTIHCRVCFTGIENHLYKGHDYFDEFIFSNPNDVAGVEKRVFGHTSSLLPHLVSLNSVSTTGTGGKKTK